jgi:hypothetical protein
MIIEAIKITLLDDILDDEGNVIGQEEKTAYEPAQPIPKGATSQAFNGEHYVVVL